MDIAVHNVTNIKIKETWHRSFVAKRIIVTDKDGHEVELTLFSDLASNLHLNIHPVKEEREDLC